jgi:hypothetical protein
LSISVRRLFFRPALPSILGINEAIKAQDGGVYGTGFWAILVAMVMNMLANRFIKKDEALVRSVDRIR